MSRVFRLNSTRLLWASAALLLAAATGAAAQQADDSNQPAPAHDVLNLPENPEIFGNAVPSVVKATALVNGDVITQTDVDHRLAFLAIASGQPVPPDQVDALRQQVLSNLIDETLEIQAAKTEDIAIKKSDIDKTIERVAANAKQTPDQMAVYLESHGSSMSSLRRQIEGEIAWRRLQQAKIESGVTIGDDEVKAVLARLTASKGTEEYRVGEIFLSATPVTESQTVGNANKILEQLRNGASFAAYAKQYSEASTAAVGGDLGWVRPEQLPPQLGDAIRQMGPGTISNPIPVSGGVSILAVQDTRKILTADPRDAVLNLKQVSISFPKGTSRQQAEPIVARFSEATRNIGGCGGAEKVASDFHGEVVEAEKNMRELPTALQQMLLPLQIGQATQPFGGIDEGVRVLVVCGRDQQETAQPTFDDIYNQLNEERVNMRARRYLRDLRRDAIIEYR